MAVDTWLLSMTIGARRCREICIARGARTRQACWLSIAGMPSLMAYLKFLFLCK